MDETSGGPRPEACGGKQLAHSGLAIAHAMDRERIPLMVPSLPLADELLPYLRQIDANRWYSNFGPLVNELEQRLAASFKGDTECHVVSASSCTAGLELALRALALPAGATVLVPALTFVATATAVRCAGHFPIAVDVDPDSWQLTPELARAALSTTRAHAVVPVTSFGLGQDGAAWSAFRSQTGLPVIMDAAAGYGNQHDPGPTCAVFSLHATKPLAAGEGGFVVTRDAELARSIRRLSNFGINLDRPADGPIGSAVAVGTNAKLSEYHAAVALASLDRWRDTVASRRDLHSKMVSAFQAACGGRLSLQRAPDNVVRAVLPLLFPDSSTCARAEATCRRRGIGVRHWYVPTVNRQPAFTHVGHLPTPVANGIGERLLGVPFYLGIGSSAIDEIATALREAF